MKRFLLTIINIDFDTDYSFDTTDLEEFILPEDTDQDILKRSDHYLNIFKSRKNRDIKTTTTFGECI